MTRARVSSLRRSSSVTGIESFYVTFGVQYTGSAVTGEVHPLGMTKDNYVVIEAPNYDIAHRIAGAIFGQEWSRLYNWNEFMGDGTFERWYNKPGAHALTIKWIQE